MRRLLCLSLILAAASARAENLIVVYSGRESVAVEAGITATAPGDPSMRAFLGDVTHDFSSQAPLEKTMELVNPPSWGKTISAATCGQISFHPSFRHGFVCRLALEGLLPGHRYILTLNGNPAMPGNSLLSTPVPGNEQERYFDFLTVTSDGKGRYDARFGIFLAPGEYNVRCYVKDTSDFKIVLYRDFFRFLVN
jgi:hypothetical protein